MDPQKQTEMVASHEARLNAINGQIARGARATEKVADEAAELKVHLTALEGKVDTHQAESKGEHKSTRKEVRLIGLAVAAATIASRFIPTPTQHAAQAALGWLGLG